jgi:DNA-binding MarR family transcriptional regulator
VTEAARHFDRSQAAMSELIARLEARGLLTRITDDRDRRRHLVWLTDHGHEALRRLTQVLSLDHLESALERMSGHDRQALIDLMTELLRAADDDARGTRRAP